MRDYYYILGVNSSASEKEIKNAYRKLSLKFHPDKNDGERFFEERFKEIQEAYETLSSQSKREFYDHKLRNSHRHTANHDQSKWEDELKKKYEEAARKHAEELRNEFLQRERKIKEEAENYKTSFKTPDREAYEAENALDRNQKHGFPIGTVVILLVFFSLIGIYFYSNGGQDKIASASISQNQVDNNSVKTIVSVPIENNSVAKDTVDYDKFWQAIAQVESEMKDDNGPAESVMNLGEDEIATYVENGKADRNIQLLRQKLDEFNHNQIEKGDQIEEMVVDSFKKYGSSYLSSKFTLATIEDYKYGGKWLEVFFIDRPDKVFFVHVLHSRINGFGDALWPKSGIEMIQRDTQALNPNNAF